MHIRAMRPPIMGYYYTPSIYGVRSTPYCTCIYVRDFSCMNCDRHCPTQKTPGIAISDRDPVLLPADPEEPASYHQYRG